MNQFLTLPSFDEILSYTVQVIFIYLGYRLILRGLRRLVEDRRVPRDAINAIELIVKLFTLLILSTGILILIDLPPEILISFSSVSGIIIGFASTEIIGEIVSGMYLLSSEPFRIHDLVNIRGIEGVVTEIGINYTTLEQFDGTIARIPNKNVIDSQITNYTRHEPKIPDILSLPAAINKQDESITGFHGMFEFIRDQLDSEDYTQYTFKINVEYNLAPSTVFERLDRVCEDYKRVFKHRPKYAVTDLGFRATILFQIISESPYLIIHNLSEFITDLANEINAMEET